MSSETLDDEMLEPIHSHWKKFFRKKSILLGLTILSVMLLMAIVGPFLSGYSYYDIDLAGKNQAPDSNHWFGTDDLGRDLFTRTWFGARISLAIGIAAALIDVTLGVIWGSIAGYCGGKIEECMMRLADILYSLPYLLIVIILSLILGSGFGSILIAMTLLGWIHMARVIQGQIRQLKQQNFVMAAVVLGARFPRLLLKHLIPNVMGSIIVTLTTSIPAAIFVEAFLSFMGLGIQAPLSSWGSMVHDGFPALSFYPWRLFFPAFAISLTMLSLNLIGDGLSDIFDLRTEGL